MMFSNNIISYNIIVMWKYIICVKWLKNYDTESFKIILLHWAIIDLIWFHWLLNCLGIFMFQLIISNIIMCRNKYDRVEVWLQQLQYMGCISKNIATGSKTASLCRKLPPKFGKFEQTNVLFRIFLRDQCMVKIIEWSLYINNFSLREGTME